MIAGGTGVCQTRPVADDGADAEPDQRPRRRAGGVPRGHRQVGVARPADGAAAERGAEREPRGRAAGSTPGPRSSDRRAISTSSWPRRAHQHLLARATRAGRPSPRRTHRDVLAHRGRDPAVHPGVVGVHEPGPRRPSRGAPAFGSPRGTHDRHAAKGVLRPWWTARRPGRPGPAWRPGRTRPAATTPRRGPGGRPPADTARHRLPVPGGSAEHGGGGARTDTPSRDC